ncbi:MAG: HAMP domain-containing histidine kinase [gamma proteobacterium symbiont of Taylorina sp.]|nr:HAMP domain-containing histidine kinase [gamma proteobacterium symbiont of Taylorina sp.]
MNFFNNMSVSLKLVLLFFMTSVAIILVLRFSTGNVFKKNFNENMRPHLSQYFHYINNEIGTPPDLNTAQRLSNELKIKIIINSSDIHWSSDDEFLAKEAINFKTHDDQYSHYESGYYKGHFIIRIMNTPYSTIFLVDTPNSPWTLLLNSLLSILLALAVLYFLLRWMISPLKKIQKSIHRIGSGELDHRINITQNDEFGQLSVEINAMADDVQNMLEAKRQLLLAISHELRSPITRAKVALSLMDNGPLKEELQIDLNEMETMIKALLDAEQLNSRHQVLKLSKTNINKIIRDTISTFYQKEKIVQKLDSIILNTLLDEARIQFVIKNLIHNALKHRKQQSDDIYITTSQTEKQICIIVEDRGFGISEDHIPLITEPFYRVDLSRQRKTGGFGLGLYLTKMIVEAHQGEIIIESKETMGTKVTIRLPPKQAQNSDS